MLLIVVISIASVVFLYLILDCISASGVLDGEKDVSSDADVFGEVDSFKSKPSKKRKN